MLNVITLDCGDVYLSSIPLNEVNLGSSFTLKCLVNSNPSVTRYTWYKNSQLVTVTSENVLNLSMNSVSDGGLYKCMVECMRRSKESTVNVKTICKLPPK